MNSRTYWKTFLDRIFENDKIQKSGLERTKGFTDLGAALERSVKPGADGVEEVRSVLWPEIRSRLMHAVQKLEQSDADTMKLVQWYNSGILLTYKHTVIGIDLITCPEFIRMELDADVIDQLSNLLDVLCVTHRHADHYDKDLVNACLQKGVPVLLPEDVYPQHSDFSGAFAGHTIAFDPLPGINIKGSQCCHVWRDHIQDVPVTVYDIALGDAYTIRCSGDADYTHPSVLDLPTDVNLFAIPWRSPNRFYEPGHPEQKSTVLEAINQLIEKSNPAQLFLEHYGELEHLYGGFEASYELALEIQREVSIPALLMAWGESIVIPINCI